MKVNEDDDSADIDEKDEQTKSPGTCIENKYEDISYKNNQPPSACDKSTKPTRKRSTCTGLSEGEEWFSHPAVEELLQKQLVHMDELDDVVDLSANPVFIVSPKRQKLPDGYSQKIQSSYSDAVKTVGNKTVLKDSGAFIEYNNSFDPRISFQGIFTQGEDQLEEDFVRTANSNFLLHMNNGADLFEQHVARYHIYLSNLSRPPAFNIKSKNSEPTGRTRNGFSDSAIHCQGEDNQPETSEDDPRSDDLKLLWTMSPSKCPVDLTVVSPPPPGAISRPSTRPWQTYAPHEDRTPLSSPPVPDSSPVSEVIPQTPEKTPLAPVPGPFWSPSVNESDEEADSPQHYPSVHTRGLNMEQLMAVYKRRDAPKISSNFWSAPPEKGEKGHRRLWDDNDLMVTGRSIGDSQLSPGLSSLKRSHSDPDLQRVGVYKSPEMPGARYAEELEKVNQVGVSEEEETKPSLNPLCSEFIPAKYSHGEASTVTNSLPTSENSAAEGPIQINQTEFPTITRAENTSNDNSNETDKLLWRGGPSQTETEYKSPNKSKPLTYAQIAKPSGTQQVGSVDNGDVPVSRVKGNKATQPKTPIDIGADDTEANPTTSVEEEAVDGTAEVKVTTSGDVVSETSEIHHAHTNASMPAYISQSGRQALSTDPTTSFSRPPFLPTPTVGSVNTITVSAMTKQGVMPGVSHPMGQIPQHLMPPPRHHVAPMSLPPRHDGMVKCNLPGQQQPPMAMLQGQPLIPVNCYPVDHHIYQISHQQNMPGVTPRQVFFPPGQNPVLTQAQSQLLGQNPHLAHPRNFPNINAPVFRRGMKPVNEGCFYPPPHGFGGVPVTTRPPPGHIPVHMPGHVGVGMTNTHPLNTAPRHHMMDAMAQDMGHGLQPLLLDQPMKKIEVNQLMQEILAASNGRQKMPPCIPRQPPGNTNSNCSAGEYATGPGKDPWKELANLTEKFKPVLPATNLMNYVYFPQKS